MLPVLTPEQVLEIYKAKQSHSRGDDVAEKLSQQYKMTPKTIRDIWNFRSWKETTRPHWTDKDKKEYMKKHGCLNCRNNGVQTIDEACNTCKAPVKQGRPKKSRGPVEKNSVAHEKNVEDNVINWQKVHDLKRKKEMIHAEMISLMQSFNAVEAEIYEEMKKKSRLERYDQVGMIIDRFGGHGGRGNELY